MTPFQTNALQPRRPENFLFTDAVSGWKWRQKFKRKSADSVAIDPESTGHRSPKMARVEAALFVADSALSARKVSQVAMLADYKEALSLIDMLNQLYDVSGSAFRIERVASGYKLLTRPQLSVWLDRVHSRQAHLKLSPPAMETLTIIAYRQPCTRADVEAIRGVQASEMIKQLLDKNLVRVVGEDDSLGRPYLYGTTRIFLESFGLSNVNELPMAELLKPKEPEEISESETDETVEETDDATLQLEPNDASSPESAEIAEPEDEEGDQAAA
ncbi:SMC-Scp complex subunit ScpB [Thalassoglobus sp. JC818]|uniref:SMC-Scp complex subunit ScpB n=1 Tax=Thalassoglobus sp. JC818 TaxID=3232136 RepID=UPI003458A8D0